MKKQGKILAIVAAIAACLAMAVGLSACGGGKADIKEVYSASVPSFTVSNPGGMDLISTSYTDLVLYSDGSYELIEKSCTYMQAYKSYVLTVTNVACGAYTYTAGEFEDTATVKLAKATRIINVFDMKSSGITYRDTADAATFEGADKTADQYLTENAKEYSLTVNPLTKTITAGLD